MFVFTWHLFPVCVLATLDSGQSLQQNSTNQYELPKDPSAVVISLDYRGGYTVPRIGDSPIMSILADGTITIPTTTAGQKALRGKLNERELQQLLDYILRENRFFEYDENAVKAKLAAGGPRVAVSDAMTVIIRVVADGKHKQVSIENLGVGMGQRIAEIEQMQAIKARLERIRSVVQLGGMQQVASWLRLINARLIAEHPEAKPLQLEHLQGGGERADGSKYLSLARVTPTVGEKTSTVTSILVIQPAGGEPQFNITHVTR